ncbi:EAL domain-containing protein [Inhella proteolytica]|uniref:EAL domain-containing protein n=1 Tax=Inhella proteolytica TaxID=2795029 RepID=A0A931J268_9BURK|nr:EAL domain-containing protein [Inhella proteolytica]MBH9576790.1 EAL domain-containing protein [Inhella proteolytica]
MPTPVAQAEPPAPHLRVGVLAVGEPAQEQGLWQPLQQHLAQSLGQRVALAVHTREQLDAALHEGRLDLVLTHPGHAVSLLHQQRVGSPIATRLMRPHPQAAEGLGSFGGVIFTLERASHPQALPELALARIAAPDRHWLGAYQMQAQELIDQGLPAPQAQQLHPVGPSQWAVVEAVLKGQAAAGFVRTGVLEDLAAAGQLDLRQIRVLGAKQWSRFPLRVSTRLYPEWPALLSPQLSPAAGARVAAALLSMPAAPGQALAGFTIPADYRDVVAVLRAHGEPPFDDTSRALLQELWLRHRLGLGLGLGALGLCALAVLWERRRLARSVRRVGMLADASRDAVFSLDRSGRLRFWGRAATRLFGPALRPGQGFATLLAPGSQDGWRQGLAHLQGPQPAELRTELVALDAAGQPFPAELTLQPVAGSQRAHHTAMLAFVRDLRPEREHQLRTRLLASVFTHAREGITITDPQGTILEVNEAFCQVTGYRREEALGRNPRLLQSGRQSPGFYRTMWETLLRRGHWSGEIWNRRKSGEVYPEMLSISAVRDPQGTLQHYVALFSDISELKSQQQRLEQVAHFDSLTGLPNRTLLGDRLSQAAAYAHRHQRCVAVAHLDIDQFTQINERLGQSLGDELLRLLARRLQLTLREDDTVARVGGDEFMLLLCDMGSPEASREVLERLQAIVAEPFSLQQHTIRLTSSLGVALYPHDSENPERVLRGAEQASYRAKQQGRNSLCYFDAAHDAALQARHQLLHALREALQQGQFRLHYQPKVDMGSGQVIGLEALIRWQHPQRGLVPPAEFLPVIEDDALGLDVGDWVLAQALRQLTEWAAAGCALPVSVNIAARHLQAPGFVERLAELLRQHPQVPPALLELEILETGALQDLQAVRQVLTAAQDLGLQFALDDFGTGYSSLAYLKNLPVRTLKIDQGFVRGMAQDPGDRAIVQAVIGLAQAFDREVIAEGVEDRELAALLLALGCRQGQGYGFARPLPPEQVPAWVRGFVASWRPLCPHEEGSAQQALGRVGVAVS